MTEYARSLPVIQGLWIGGELSVIEKLSIASFLKNGHRVHLYTYEGVTGAPEGTEIMDGREILGADRIFKYKREGSYAGFSNVFRYKLLLERGQYWADLDVVCLRPFTLDREYVFSGAYSRRWFGLGGREQFIQSCVIRTPPGAPVMKYCYDMASAKVPDQLVWGEIGPNLLQSAVRSHNLTRFVSRNRQFSTIDWRLMGSFVSGDPWVAWSSRLKPIIFRPYATHLYNEMWRQNGLDKNAQYPSISYLEALKRRYL